VEDRPGSALWLEMTDRPARQYAARAAEVAGRGGVEKAWWLSNAHRRRTDLPMRLEEFSTLGLFEVGGCFSPPVPPEPPGQPPPDTRSLHFRRTPRPGQGVLTGRPTTGILLVMVSPRSPDGAAELRDWADFVHIRHIAAAAVPGYTMITPYERVGGGDPRFLHLYEMDSGDPEAVFASMTPLVRERLGTAEAFGEWAGHPALRIEYVNTFRVEGSLVPGGVA
jgi:hypothetical protein